LVLAAEARVIHALHVKAIVSAPSRNASKTFTSTSSHEINVYDIIGSDGHPTGLFDRLPILVPSRSQIIVIRVALLQGRRLEGAESTRLLRQVIVEEQLGTLWQADIYACAEVVWRLTRNECRLL
jgi:hypothetical protein